jgi:ABC-type Fe3+-hydroxamate transport system substrate-binding protein
MMPARRIVSLVPSQTELLSDLGLDGEVVGITKFCIHPENWKFTKTIVGGTKNVHIDVVDSLRPDLIIANKEENTKEDVEALMKKYRVHVTDVSTVEEAYGMMMDVAKLTGTDASKIISEVRGSFSSLPSFKIQRALYLIWKKPWMAAGKDTFISDVMRVAGFQNAVSDNRYPELSKEDLLRLDPEVVLLSSEPYPFKEQHVDEVKKMLPSAQVMLVDGEMFSWYGSRILRSARYFTTFRTALS